MNGSNTLDFSRLTPSLDVASLRAKVVVMMGGAFGLLLDLVRSGVGSVIAVDFDRVDRSNPTRQDFDAMSHGMRKVAHFEQAARRIHPDVEIDTYVQDICALSSEEFARQFGHADLAIVALDSFPAGARCNREFVRMGISALHLGIYRGGSAGEIVVALPGSPCYRCICSKRYEAFMRGTSRVSSAGGTIFDLRNVDAIAGQLALGILTAGADNRYGRLIERLGNRPLLQVKLDPDYRLGERDIFAEKLGDSPAQFSFTTMALSAERNPLCPDCAESSARHPTSRRDDNP